MIYREKMPKCLQAKTPFPGLPKPCRFSPNRLMSRRAARHSIVCRECWWARETMSRWRRFVLLKKKRRKAAFIICNFKEEATLPELPPEIVSVITLIMVT